MEEEYHLVDADTAELINAPELSAQALAGSTDQRLRPEMLTSQLEAATEVCTDLEQLRRAILGARSAAATAAAQHGAAILATSTHPFASLSEIEVMGRPRYRRLQECFGTIVDQFNLCGCHVHVSVPDLDTAVGVMNLARPYLPLLTALTGSSPFHQGHDTGYDSFRLAWLALWPQGGPPPYFASAEDYVASVTHSKEIGLTEDASDLLWDIRPSARYPTLEFRSGDVCTDVDDAVLYAAVVRSLVRTLAARVEACSSSPQISETGLRASRWRAARYGLSGTLWSLARARMVPAAVAIDDLIAELREDLAAHDEHAIVDELFTRLRSRGNSATRQRQGHAATGSLLEVTRFAMSLTSSPA